MPDTFINRLQCAITNAPGTAGALTVGAAASGCRTFGAAQNGLTFTVTITDGTAWEVRSGCTYTHAGTSLSRGVLVDSSTGSAISLTSAATVILALSADAAGGVTVPGLTINSAGAAAANTTVLQALAASLATVNTSRLKLIFPDGDVYYNGVVNWVVYGNQNVTVTPITESQWPEFDSTGTTTFRWSGGQINGGSWVFQHATGSQISTRLRMRNLRWAGPGVQVRSLAVATTSVGAAATTVTVAAIGSTVVGDAIAISANATPAGTLNPTSMPWWATVTNVVGNTITFAPATCTNFAASIGNVVQVFKQCAAVQIGGVTSTRQDFFYLVEFERCAWIDWFTGVTGQDVTALNFKGQCIWNYCMYGLESGYNFDSVRWEQPAMLCQLVSISCAVNATKVVTLPYTTGLRPGMALSDITAPGTAQAFPEWACIETVDSSTQVTMTHAATLSGTRTLLPVMGWMAAQGSGNSPWYPRELTPYDGSRQNADQWQFVNPTINHCKGLYITDSGTNSSIVAEDVYLELCSRLAIVGNQGGNSTLGPYVFRRMVFSNAASFTGAPFETIGGGVNVEWSDVVSAASTAFPAIKFSNSGNNTQIVWTRNTYVTSFAGGAIVPNTYWFGAITASSGAAAIININDNGATGIVAAITGNGTINSEILGYDGFNITLNGNSTLSNVTSFATSVWGKRFRIAVKATGAFTFNPGALFVKQDGTAIGAITGANTKTCVMDFVGDGTKYLLVGGTLAAGVPAFV